MEIKKLVKPCKTQFFSRKEGKKYGVNGAIRFPRTFAGKSFHVSFESAVVDGVNYDAEEIDVVIYKCGPGGVAVFPKKYVGRNCIITIKDEDVFEYFRKRFED